MHAMDHEDTTIIYPTFIVNGKAPQTVISLAYTSSELATVADQPAKPRH